MNALIFCIFFFNLTNILCGFLFSDLCRKETNDKSHVMTINNKCFDKFPIKCHQNYCTKSKKVCEEYDILRIYIKMESNFKIKDNLNSMIETIQKCKDKWKSTDICIKSDSCYIKEHNFFNGASYKFINNSKVCPCGNGHRFKCNGNNNFCGVNKEACDNVLQNRNELYKKCGKLNIKFIFFKIIKFVFFILEPALLKNKPVIRMG